MQTAIIDYGMGNLHSVLKSVRTAGQLAGKNTKIFLSG
ncbi:imidazole glycerol phosphate synthase subunit HisH, partial [Neisseria gonorrhoeae]